MRFDEDESENVLPFILQQTNTWQMSLLQYIVSK